MRSIRKRLIGNYITIALVTVLILEGLFAVAISEYYIGGVERILVNQAETSATFFNRYADAGDIYKKSNYIFENLDIDEAALIEVVDMQGRVVIDSTGSSTENVINTFDVTQALRGQSEVWRGRSDLNEPIVAVSAPIYDGTSVVGALRYVSSLAPTYQVLGQFFAMLFLFGFGIIAVAFLYGRAMAQRILEPVQELVRVTEEVAQGNYKVTAIKYHNDEIGQLVDAVNIMTKEITRADQAKSEFISSISHELRTPLAAIKGWAETMQDMKDDIEVVEEGLSIVSKETDRLIILVNDLLDFSRLQAHRIELKKEEFSISDLLENIIGQFTVRCQQEHIKMTLLTDNQENWVFADYNRLKQVLINIVDNAMKFTVGRPEAEIRISSQVLDDQIIVIIEDNGSGISPEDLQRVKEKFYKGSSNKSGTGLGLSIASEIMELHGGKMLIDSTMNVGTKVVLVMPFFYDVQQLED
ncbi:MAG: HAMP domain-containing histidine kinase [Peptococcaceae bacterium]|nr:HAMP domain-containing histidine kinase [Peptococcaceae bacterium]MBQ2432028.1 HAMP domain-containing histidine kinase [Peptococcaceae bacterium]MBQ5368662.1 HAMP domain-containing histidine kinase [Peptococcaceae bacterium]MBQ5614803.1 HAMP domain-containing histidine kinase [Peptococcaceae bacterium]MBQ5659609.1 HAMP domain-containing histidine kinase [Peptococcaceae bacterium]